MLHVNNSHEKSYVITYKELIFTFIVFSAILFVLYPKDLLKEQILSEKSNYDLSMLYLKNLLQHSPDDESLMLILAEQSLRSGNKDLSLRLLNLLLDSKDEKIQHKATLLSYDLQKIEYYYLKNEGHSREKLLEKKRILVKLFSSIFNLKMFAPDDIEKWYQESLFVDNRKARHFFLNAKIKKDPTNIVLLEEDYYLEKSLHHWAEILKTLQALQKYDKRRERKWVIAEYYIHLNYKEYDIAEQLLIKHLDSGVFYKQKLAEFYLMKKEYIKASEIYESLLVESNTYTAQKEYFYKMVQALQAGNKLEKTAEKVKEYEASYIHDIEARNFMLKIYMATGKLDYASSLSKKILRGGL